ncbi:MAG: ABC transporter substrate-binding protein [Aristaeellaceae bacterium]
MKKLVALVLAAMMLCASFAFAEAPEGYPEVVPGIDFGGATVTIYDYWSGNGDRVDDPTDEQQAQYDYRDWLEATYNVKIVQKQGGDWGTCAETMIDFVSQPDGSYRVYIIEPGKVGSLVANGVAAPITYDMSGEKWNAANISMWSKNGVAYGFSTGAHEPRGGVYFNKRVLGEANIDWNTIYDMQAAGTWTWAAFEEMLKATTRDTNNDGVIDIYGLVGSADDMYVLAVATNGGSFFDYDAEGKLQPTMGSEATLNALNWARDIKLKYWAPTPDGANWDWYKEAWKTGAYAFYMYQAYGGFNPNSEMADMEDEWGFVAFPVPNEGDTYLTTVSENTYLIPNIYSEEEINKIMFIVDMWTNATPGYDDEFAWIGDKYNYTDDRAVDETYAMLRDGAHGWANLVVLLGTQNAILGQSLLWSLDGSTPAELIEAGMPAWQAACDTFNSK